ncbi:hypothetical protein [Streptomyces sp. NRRL F-5755]|uniref:hypothetical protein n=1 Tax=Streptomyces sp. NRRL F-5755 TaxID=1519475 RepID=UPI001F2B5459|nr:hypothetical protein [Streptomyces sp. NRRL F-5755]
MTTAGTTATTTRETTAGTAPTGTGTGTGTGSAPPPRWVIRLAHLTALTPLPSSLWRITAALGIPVGFTGDGPMTTVTFGSWFSLYMIALSLFADGLGLLALGLVRRWGEIFPRWIPLIGGRRVPTAVAVVPAGLGATALTVLGMMGTLGWNAPDTMGHPDSPDGIAYWAMTACYLPLVAWGPLLAVVTGHYWLRRHRARGSQSRHLRRPG